MKEPEGPGIGYTIWFMFCALLGVALMGCFILLAIAAVGWLGRH